MATYISKIIYFTRRAGNAGSGVSTLVSTLTSSVQSITREESERQILLNYYFSCHELANSEKSKKAGAWKGVMRFWDHITNSIPPRQRCMFSGSNSSSNEFLLAPALQLLLASKLRGMVFLFNRWFSSVMVTCAPRSSWFFLWCVFFNMTGRGISWTGLTRRSSLKFLTWH